MSVPSEIKRVCRQCGAVLHVVHTLPRIADGERFHTRETPDGGLDSCGPVRWTEITRDEWLAGQAAPPFRPPR